MVFARRERGRVRRGRCIFSGRLQHLADPRSPSASRSAFCLLKPKLPSSLSRLPFNIFAGMHGTSRFYLCVFPPLPRPDLQAPFWARSSPIALSRPNMYFTGRRECPRASCDRRAPRARSLSPFVGGSSIRVEKSTANWFLMGGEVTDSCLTTM